MQPHWFYHCSGDRFFWVPWNQNSFITENFINFLNTTQPNRLYQSHHHQFSGWCTSTLVLPLPSPRTFEYHTNTRILSLQQSAPFEYHKITLLLSVQRSSVFCTIRPHWFFHRKRSSICWVPLNHTVFFCNGHRFFEQHTTTLVSSLQESSVFQYHTATLHWFYHCVLKNQPLSIFATPPVFSLHRSSNLWVPYNIVGFTTKTVISFWNAMQPHWFYSCDSVRSKEYNRTTLVLSLQSSIFWITCNDNGLSLQRLLFFRVPCNHSVFVTATFVDLLSTKQSIYCNGHRFFEHHTTIIVSSLQQSSIVEYHTATLHWFYHRVHKNQPLSIFEYHATILFFFTASDINFLSTIQQRWFYHWNGHQFLECHATTLVLLMQRWSFFWFQQNHTGFFYSIVCRAQFYYVI